MRPRAETPRHPGTTRIELLAPARDLACGVAAINSGADAVYIGAPQFGARAKVGNSLADIAALVAHAHTYWARVYVTVNTLLYDHEVPQAVRLIHQLYERGVDAVIIQDVGLLECDLPPMPLIASTQMHNHRPEKVAFLEKVGLQRVILARELSLDQIRAIREQSSIELETFVHGALCVSYSGQCYMSYAIGGRSGNRGECAQPCRRCYDLVDRNGQTLIQQRYLLSLRDLNLSQHLGELLDVGVTSFKIEGRLKDETYVTNVVSHYRQQLDALIQERGLQKSSSGHSHIDFEPDVSKTFNRGYTNFFLHGRATSPGAIDTPKMTGELLGEVVYVTWETFTLDTPAKVHSGDGLCFFDAQHTLRGTVVNGTRGRAILPDKMDSITKGMRIYRNHDHAYLSQVRKSQVTRKIAIQLTFTAALDGFQLTAVDEDGNRAIGHLQGDKVAAKQPHQALNNARTQLQKTGNTVYECVNIEIDWEKAYFLPFSALNALRRSTLAQLDAVRAQNRPAPEASMHPNNAPYPQSHVSYLGNALNGHAVDFYHRHGVTHVEPAAESGLDMAGKKVMQSKYCIKHELGWCPRLGNPPNLAEPLYLVDENGHSYELRFNCAACEMEVIF